MARFLSVNPTYNPFTMDEMLKIPLLYDARFREVEKEYNELQDKAALLRLYAKESPEASRILQEYDNAMQNVSDSIASGKLSSSMINSARDMRKLYRDNIIPMSVAASKYDEYRTNYLKNMDGTEIGQQYSFDDFIKNPNLIDKTIKGSAIQAQLAKLIGQQALTRQIPENWKPTMGGQYYSGYTGSGYTDEEIASYMSNPNINTNITNIVSNFKQNIGYNEMTPEQKATADSYINNAIVIGMAGNRKYETHQNRGYRSGSRPGGGSNNDQLYAAVLDNWAIGSESDANALIAINYFKNSNPQYIADWAENNPNMNDRLHELLMPEKSQSAQNNYMPFRIPMALPQNSNIKSSGGHLFQSGGNTNYDWLYSYLGVDKQAKSNQFNSAVKDVSKFDKKQKAQYIKNAQKNKQIVDNVVTWPVENLHTAGTYSDLSENTALTDDQKEMLELTDRNNEKANAFYRKLTSQYNTYSKAKNMIQAYDTYIESRPFPSFTEYRNKSAEPLKVTTSEYNKAKQHYLKSLAEEAEKEVFGNERKEMVKSSYFNTKPLLNDYKNMDFSNKDSYISNEEPLITSRKAAQNIVDNTSKNIKNKGFIFRDNNGNVLSRKDFLASNLVRQGDNMVRLGSIDDATDKQGQDILTRFNEGRSDKNKIKRIDITAENAINGELTYIFDYNKDGSVNEKKTDVVSIKKLKENDILNAYNYWVSYVKNIYKDHIKSNWSDKQVLTYLHNIGQLGDALGYLDDIIRVAMSNQTNPEPTQSDINKTIIP